MMDTLKNGENLLVEKVSYHFTDPGRFDVIVFYPHGRDSSDYYIKRVIGLPGETVEIDGEDIYIDGEVLEEDYGKTDITFPGIAEDPVVLGDDEYFVLGDNRGISKDSRSFGAVKKENIYINDEKIEENFGKDPIMDPGIAEEPIKLGDDEFFVLGDNRTVSEDSRYEEVGPVKRENIEGRAILRIYPLSEFGTFE